MRNLIRKGLIDKIPFRTFRFGDCHRHKSSTFDIGATAEIERTFTEDDVRLFSHLTRDNNPIHLDREAARQRRFNKPVVHGALINGVISAVIGTILPGHGSILLEQDLHFPNPLYIDEKFLTRVTISDRKRNLFYCRYECITVDGGKKVTEGMAKILFRS